MNNLKSLLLTFSSTVIAYLSFSPLVGSAYSQDAFVSASGGSIYVHTYKSNQFDSKVFSVQNFWGGPRRRQGTQYSGFTNIGDFDGDGTDDIATAIRDSVYIHYSLNDGSGFNTTVHPVPDGGAFAPDIANAIRNWGGAEFTFVGDFDGNGTDDIASANGGEIYVHLTNNSRDEGLRTIISRGPNRWGGAEYTWVGDFDGNGTDDIASADGGNIIVRLSNRRGIFNNQTWTVPNRWGGARYTWVDDFDGNGTDDIASAEGGIIYVHLSTGVGFETSTSNVPNNWGGPDYTWVGNFDRSPGADIVSARGGSINVLLSRSGLFEPQTWNVPNSWGGEGYNLVGDFDGNGTDDIASANGSNIYLLLSNVNNSRDGNIFFDRVLPVADGNRWGSAGYTFVLSNP